MINISLSDLRGHWQIWAVSGFALILIAGIVGTAMLGSGQERSRHLRSFMLTSISGARQLGEHARQSIAHADLALRSAQRAFEAEVRSAKKPANAWRPSRRLHLQLRRLAAAVPQIASIRIVDASGVVRHSSRRVPARPAKSEKTGYFTALNRRRNVRHVGTVTVGSKRPRTYITVSRRINGANRKLLGIVTARLYVSYFTRLYAAGARRRSVAAALIAPGGVVLASYPARSRDGKRVAGRAVKAVPFLKDLPRLKVRRNRARGFSTGRAVGAIYRGGAHNLRLAITAPPDLALARWDTDFWYRLMIIGVTALLVCGFLVLLSSQLLKGRLPAVANVAAKEGRPAGPEPRTDAERQAERDRRRRAKAAKRSESSRGDDADPGAEGELGMEMIVAKLTKMFQREKTEPRAKGEWGIGEKAAMLSKLFKGDKTERRRDDEPRVDGEGDRDANAAKGPDLSPPEKPERRGDDNARGDGQGLDRPPRDEEPRADSGRRGEEKAAKRSKLFLPDTSERPGDDEPRGGDDARAEDERHDRPAERAGADGPAETGTPPTFGIGHPKYKS